MRRSEQSRSDSPGVAPAVRVPTDAPAPAAVELHNIVSFVRSRMAEAHAPAVTVPEHSDRPTESLVRDRWRLAAFAALSLAVHVGLFAAFWREPEPLASIGLEVISVELVIGATAPAGAAQAPGEQDQQTVAAPADPVPPEPPQEAKQKATEQVQSVPVGPQEKAPEQTAAMEKPVEAQKPPVAIEIPQPEAPARETPPATMQMALLPPPEEKPPEPRTEQKPEPQPEQAAPPKPVKNAAPAKEQRRIEAPTKDRAQKQANAAPSSAANNVGVGRSDRDTNYPGIVSAHLRRYQQYPSDARGRGDQGTATVSFSLDGGGRVTSARLVRGSGIASIDTEVQAMVRRASPFPAPPSGQAASFTVPVSFRLN